MKNVDTFINDDYAGLDAGDLEFYYGYEFVFCPKHGYSECGSCECDEDLEWCFVVRKKGKRIFMRRRSELTTEDYEEPIRCLMTGIGLYLADQQNKKKKVGCVKK